MLILNKGKNHDFIGAVADIKFYESRERSSKDSVIIIYIMPMRKYNKKQSKRKMNKSKRRNTRKKGGGCGCATKSIGGYNSNLSQVISQPHSVIPYKDNVTTDPLSPANLVSGRLAGDFSRGGGSKKRKIMKKRKGGAGVFSNLYSQYTNSGSGMNAYTSFGAINSADTQATTISGITGSPLHQSTNPPVLSQPYGGHNPPLV